jgi:hypothetical protein
VAIDPAVSTGEDADETGIIGWPDCRMWGQRTICPKSYANGRGTNPSQLSGGVAQDQPGPHIAERPH